ncbi:MAG: hypothetical protein ACQEUI_13010 [Actinomycetota bacterium]
MSRVHCLECGNQVVVDPRGLCPDGHEVGTDGARIEHAIGQEAVHPHEPEPWVYRIGADEVTVPARPPAVGSLLSTQGDGNGNGAGPSRRARPLRAPGLPDDSSQDGSGDAESLLRELHSLAALDESLAERGEAVAERNGHSAQRRPEASAAAPPPPPTDLTTPATAAATTPRPTRGDPSAIADAFAELSALDVPTSNPSRAGTSASAHASSTTSPAGADAARPTPPSAPTETRQHSGATAAAGDQGRSQLRNEGLLFDRGDEPDPARDPVDEVTGDRSAGDSQRGEQAPEREYEATLSVATPRRRQRSASRNGAAHSNGAAARNGAPPRSPDAGAHAAVPPPTPPPEATEHHGPTTNGHRVSVPDTGGPDLSSFTAKGGPGSGKTRARRRRLAR